MGTQRITVLILRIGFGSHGCVVVRDVVRDVVRNVARSEQPMDTPIEGPHRGPTGATMWQPSGLVLLGL